MSLRTKESLQRLFEASRLRNEKRKQEEQLKYKKASQSVKKALADKLSTEQKKTSQKGWKQQTEAISRTLTIYNSRYIERFADENELYTTREQLEEAMPNCINWTLWNKLVEETKKSIYYDKH